ncbi:unnamed protein product [Trichobilharzia regenti]|nr:unnamed protein product [Trichobilharzia regenti]
MNYYVQMDDVLKFMNGKHAIWVKSLVMLLSQQITNLKMNEQICGVYYSMVKNIIPLMGKCSLMQR